MSYTIAKRGLVDEFTWIWHMDPALRVLGKDGEVDEDGILERHRLYSENGDESHLQFLPDCKPVRWTLRQLSGLEIRYVRDLWREKGQARALYKLAALSIVGTDIKDSSGKRWEVRQVADSEGFMCAPHDLMEALDKNRSTVGLIDAIGLAAWERSQPSPK